MKRPLPDARSRSPIEVPRAPLVTPRGRLSGVSRRGLLGGAAAGAAALALPKRARAATVSPADRKFLFVYAMGGWDMTRVFAPLFGLDTVDMEADAEPATAGDIPYVDHPSRPSVRAFFDAYHDRLAIVNGFYISSISHSSASRMVTTGTPDASKADWPSRLAAWKADQHVVPYLVVGGPNFSGPYGVHVGHAGTTGQLQGLASGEILALTDGTAPTFSEADGTRVDAYLRDVAARRAAAAGYGPLSQRYQASYGTALEKAARLKELSATVDFDRGDVFADQVALAARALSLGISRCVAVSHPRPEVNVLWDSHANNDMEQTMLFEDLFAELLDLVDVLENTPGTVSDTLMDETVVVCLSEMGRTPKINGSNGKDHWPYGTAMLFGAGVRGGQVVGGFDENQYGVDIDPVTGQASDTGSAIGPNVLGATLMVLGDVDPLDEDLVDTPVTALIDD